MWQLIQKFSVDHCDLPTMIWNVSVFLRPLTLNIDSKNKKGIPRFFYIATSVGFALYFYVYMFCVMWFVFIRCPQTGDLLAATVLLSVGMSSEIGTVKLLYMFMYIEKIRKLTAAYLEFDSQVVPGTRLRDNLLKYSRIVKRRALIYVFIMWSNAVLYIVMPIIRPGRHFTEDYFVIYGLEPMFESPNYEIAWTIMGISIVFICYISTNVTGYLIIIAGYTEAQMLALSEEMLHLWTDATEYYQTVKITDNISDDYQIKFRIINKHVNENLKEIIRRHAAIKNIFGQVEGVFRGAIAAEFFFLILGLISELLGGLENTYLLLIFSFMQASVDCFSGQRVIDAGEVFEEAVYDCKWENFDKNNMKMVLVMLQNSQKTMAISAGGLINLSFECLMAAVKATYSAYTALRSIMD